jgi:O-antigen ligase
MFIQMACCAMSGGRGGVALLAVYVVMSLYYAKKLQILNNSKITIICVLGFLAATYVYNVFDLSHSEGLLRVINAAEDGNVTREDWTHAYPFFLKSPWFGYGPGANFYNIGFYSHGVFSDFYFENGIIGGSILLYFYIHVIRKCLKLMRVDAIYILFMLVFAYALVFNLFSGFYVSTQLNWMALGVAYGYRNKFAPKSKYNRIS